MNTMMSWMKVKNIVVILMLVVAMTACQKETYPLTMEAAIKKAEKVIRRYPNCDWYASKNVLEPCTTLLYSKFGILWDRPELINEYVSPNFRAWLVAIVEIETDIASAPEKCLHLFIDADTGHYEEVWLKGMAIVEWGSTPFSRAMQMQSGE